MPAAGVRVEGLREFRREIKRLDNADEINKQLKDAHYRIATMLIPLMHARAGGLGRIQTKAAATLRPGRALKGASISYGGVPYAMGAEFGAGSNIPRRRGTWTQLGWNQFRAHRGKEGYFVWPTINHETDRIVDTYADEMEKIARAAFPD